MSRKCDFGVLPFNWRDVGVALHSLDVSGLLPAGRIHRCGLIDQQRWDDMGMPGTIINLRPERDTGPVELPASVILHHTPIEDNSDHIAYSTTDSRTASWINSVLQCVQNATPPILIHCRSGKDRTGVIIAALLTLLHVPPAIIIREYELTHSDLRSAQFQEALVGLTSNSSWREGLDSHKLAQVLCAPVSPPPNGISDHQVVLDEEIKFLSDFLKQIFAMANPANVAQELRELRVNMREIPVVEDSDEQLQLTRVLLPTAERMIAVSGSAMLGRMVKAASLEHLAFAQLVDGQQKLADDQLRDAALSWAAVISSEGGGHKALHKLCATHQANCEGAMS